LLSIWFVSTVASGLWLIGHAYRTMSIRGFLEGPRLGYRHLASGHEGILSFVLATQANTTLAASTRQLPIVIVGMLLSTSAAGLYNIARQVTTLLSKFTKLMKPAIYPEFARLSAQNDLAAIRQLMLRSMALTAGVGALLMAILIIFGRALLVLIFGPEVEGAYGLMLVLAFVAIIRLSAFPLEPVLISVGRAGSALRVRSVTVSIFILALFTLIPAFGVIGAGLASVIAVSISVAGQARSVVRWFRSRSQEAAVAP
jgi:O-antigen/teichoic acid export membrane protein